MTLKTLTGKGGRHFSGGGGFTPLSIPNLVGWWKANTGITGSAGTIGVADQSGNGNNMGAASNGVTVSSVGGYNGHPSFIFTGIGGLINTTVNVGTGAILSFWMIGQLSSTATSFVRYASYIGNGLSHDYDNPNSLAWAGNSPDTQLNFDFDNNTGGPTPSISTNTNYRLMGTLNSNIPTIWVNNVSNGGTFLNSLSLTSPGSLGLGCGGGTIGTYFSGPVAEFGCCTSDLTSVASSLDGYLVSTYGA